MIIKKNYKYFVNALQIVFPNDSKPLTVEPQMVRGISLEKDFDGDFFPVCKLDVSVSREVAHRIIAEKTGVKIKLDMRKREYDHDKVLKTTSFINTTFITFLDEDTPFFEDKEVSGNRDNSGDNPAMADTPLSLYLFKENDLLNSKLIINDVLDHVTISNAIGYLCDQAKVRNVLFSLPDNKGTFDEMLLPPQTFIGNMAYLNSRYGIYKNGLTLFFDLTRMYIIHRQAKCTAWEKDEQKELELRVSQPRDSQTISSGHEYDDVTELIKTRVPYTDVSITAPSVLQDQLEGNNRLFIDSRFNKKTTQKNTLEQRGGGTYKLMRLKYPQNPYLMTMEAARIKTASKIIQLPLKDVDVSLFTPNKQYMLKFDQTTVNKVHGGLYRLAMVRFMFAGSAEDMNVTGIAQLQP